MLIITASTGYVQLACYDNWQNHFVYPSLYSSPTDKAKHCVSLVISNSVVRSAVKTQNLTAVWGQTSTRRADSEQKPSKTKRGLDASYQHKSLGVSWLHRSALQLLLATHCFATKAAIAITLALRFGTSNTQPSVIMRLTRFDPNASCLTNRPAMLTLA